MLRYRNHAHHSLNVLRRHFPCGTPCWGRSWSSLEAVCGEREEADLVNVKVKSVPHKMVIKVPQIDLDSRADEQVERLLGKWNLRSGANAPPPGALKFYGQP